MRSDGADRLMAFTAMRSGVRAWRAGWRLLLVVTVLAGGVALRPAAAAGTLYKDAAIYQAQVPVQDESAKVRGAAVNKALGQVLVRITGDAQVDATPAAAAVLKQSSQLMQSYSYVQLPSGEGLQVSFDPGALKAAVRAQHLPLWDSERPRTLVWLALRGPNGRQLVSSDDAQGSAAGLVNTAQARGIPLLFPLMDLQDQRLVSFPDVWGGFQQPVLKASKRYPHSDVLMASAAGGNGQWQVQWTLLRDGKRPKQWRTSAAQLDGALAAGANDLANFFASRFAVVPGSGAPHVRRVIVDNVHGVDAYASVLSYLRGLTAIQSVHAVRIDGATVTWRVTSDAPPHYLRRVLGLSGLLTTEQGAPASAASAQGASGKALRYRLANQF